MNKFFVFTTLFVIIGIHYTFAQNIINCGIKSGFCDQCVKSSSKCYYCDTDRLCRPYPYRQGFPTLAGECNLRDARWATCTINLLMMIILISIAAALVLLSLLSCFCWCWIRNRRRRQQEWHRLEEKQKQDKEEREALHQERKAERDAKWGGLRNKYGIANKDEAQQE